MQHNIHQSSFLSKSISLKILLAFFFFPSDLLINTVIFLFLLRFVKKQSITIPRFCQVKYKILLDSDLHIIYNDFTKFLKECQLNREERDNIVKKLREEYPIEEQTKFNEFNIGDKLQENTSLKLMYQDLYEKEKFFYDQLKVKYNIIVGKRYDFYRFEFDRNLTKTEVEQYYLPKDSKILKMKSILQKQEIRVKFFEICMKSIDNLYWRIKYFIDNEKI